MFQLIFQPTVKHYRQSYIEAVDLAISTIQDHFLYRSLEQLLLNTIHGESTQAMYNYVCKFYNSDFDCQRLQLHLEILQITFTEGLKSATLCINDLKYFILGLSENERAVIGEVVTLLKL